MKNKKPFRAVDSVRKPTAPGTIRHGNDKYTRKEKHKKTETE